MSASARYGRQQHRAVHVAMAARLVHDDRGARRRRARAPTGAARGSAPAGTSGKPERISRSGSPAQCRSSVVTWRRDASRCRARSSSQGTGAPASGGGTERERSEPDAATVQCGPVPSTFRRAAASSTSTWLGEHRVGQRQLEHDRQDLVATLAPPEARDRHPAALTCREPVVVVASLRGLPVGRRVRAHDRSA